MSMGTSQECQIKERPVLVGFKAVGHPVFGVIKLER
jgi:hypothetical protein